MAGKKVLSTEDVNPLHDCYLKVHVQGQNPMTAGQRQLLKNAFKDGVDLPTSLRFTCRIAEDVKLTIGDGIEFDGQVYKLNPAATPQFGKNKDGHAFLSFSLNRESDGKFFGFSWVGDAVPYKMKQVAVKHDLGEPVRACSIKLSFADAKVRLKPEPSGGRRDSRPSNRPRLKGGRPSHARHDRLGKCDI